MNNPNQRSAVVTASGVIAILGSTVAAIGVLLGTVGVLILPPPRARVPGILPIMFVMMAAFFAITVWGIFAGIGLLRFRNWARMSVLVWSGMTAPISLLIVVVFLFMPLPMPPGSPARVGAFTRLFIVLFYGAPLAIAIWWLILFTRTRIVTQFKRAQFASAQLSSPGALPIEGDPALGASATVWSPDSAAPGAYAPVPPPMPTPDLPIPIIVLACFFLLSSLSFVMVFLMHMPAMLFGVAIGGAAGTAVYVVWCLLYVSSGVGILKRVAWSYSVAIGLQILGLVSGGGAATVAFLDESTLRLTIPAAKSGPQDIVLTRTGANGESYTLENGVASV